MAENEIERLIYLFAKLPGLGPRSARRTVLHMLKYRESFMLPLAEAIKNTAILIKECEICGNLDNRSPCSICVSHNRDKSIICVVETISDLLAIERGSIFKGEYHILGGTLSASDNVSPDDLNLTKLIERANALHVNEIILATNATVEGQTTAYYITELLTSCDVKVSRLAYGIPVGGELDYLDEGTLSAALKSRQPF
jgi:recombination protein RecR